MTMECDQVRELLEAYAVGALSEDEQAMVAAHLVDCPECQQIAADYAAIVGMLPDAVAVTSGLQPPGAVKTRVLETIAQPSIKPASPQPQDAVPTTSSSKRSTSS